MLDETARGRAARAAAEQALIRVVHHYGGRPEFVLLGGLIPDLLCSTSDVRHAGTTDVDVQVDLEIALGLTSARRLERALLNAEFAPDDQRAWRWVAEGPTPRAVVMFELLTDQDDIPSEATVTFDGCDDLGAVNLRGTGYASRDVEVRKLHGRIGGVDHTAEINVTGLAGFLLAKTAAARSRRKPKDWYDIAYVLLNNDAGGAEAAALDRFGSEIDTLRTSLGDLRANSLRLRPKARPPTPNSSRWTTRKWIELQPQQTPCSAWNASSTASCRHPHVSADQSTASLRSPRGQPAVAAAPMNRVLVLGGVHREPRATVASGLHAVRDLCGSLRVSQAQWRVAAPTWARDAELHRQPTASSDRRARSARDHVRSLARHQQSAAAGLVQCVPASCR